MAVERDPYQVLGLPRGASLEDVKRAYRGLAKANHPDAAGPAALPRFLAIQAAYESIAGGESTGPRGTRPSSRASAADPDRAGATHRAYGARGRRPRPGPTPGGYAGGGRAAAGPRLRAVRVARTAAGPLPAGQGGPVAARRRDRRVERGPDSGRCAGRRRPDFDRRRGRVRWCSRLRRRGRFRHSLVRRRGDVRWRGDVRRRGHVRWRGRFRRSRLGWRIASGAAASALGQAAGDASGSPRPGSTAGSTTGSHRPTGPDPTADGDTAARADAPPGREEARRRRNKATLGSTSYDGADATPFEPDWGGASWYGTTSGTYWTLNPKEYADPRKHGPEYQARARRWKRGRPAEETNRQRPGSGHRERLGLGRPRRRCGERRPSVVEVGPRAHHDVMVGVHLRTRRPAIR